MTRSPITIPTRLQVLSFFLVVENVVKHVIARLKEDDAPPVEEPKATSDLDETMAEIRQNLDALNAIKAQTNAEAPTPFEVLELLKAQPSLVSQVAHSPFIAFALADALSFKPEAKPDDG